MMVDNSEHKSTEIGEAKEVFSHGIVANIPAEFHSSDLRSFFSQFIESKGFSCFHFRHRPEISQTDDCDKHVNGKTFCCVVSLLETKLEEVIRKYHGQNWVDRTGKYLTQRAVIKRIKVRGNRDTSKEEYLTKQQRKQSTKDRVEFLQTDLDKLSELCPPPIMPNGNVGTPLVVFVELIRTCSFPPKLIKKLGLTFPKSLSQKRYGNVPLDYATLEGSSIRNNIRTATEISTEEQEVVPLDSSVQDEHFQNDQTVSSFYTSSRMKRKKRIQCGLSGDLHSKDGNIKVDQSSLEKENDLVSVTGISGKPADCDDDSVMPNQRTKHHTENVKQDQNFSKTQMGRKDTINSDNSSYESVARISDAEDEFEEWDRHETLHNDVDNQGRTKERLFEDEIELKWEKGGSGLVFYTDAQFWQKQENADFDEETADDWDVDMSIYDEPDGGDKDARDLLQMRIEDQWRRGNIIDPNRVGGFEKHTKGFGGRVMRRQGWKEGQGLGSSREGLAEPVQADGQKPTSKRGLGYYGEKLDRTVKRPCAERDVIVKTIYDKPDERNTDPYLTEGPHILTYRDSVEFVPSRDTKSL